MPAPSWRSRLRQWCRASRVAALGASERAAARRLRYQSSPDLATQPDDEVFGERMHVVKQGGPTPYRGGQCDLDMFGTSHVHRRGVRTALLLVAGSPRHVTDAPHGDDHGDVRQSLRTVDVIEDAGAGSAPASVDFDL